ncbi:hypothetical protein [Mesorhizobium vachelliae]|uniref:hypothetical protein n=1 Tax=Mesorhizobium vachelliae TaxID=3072309 RepID=UPI003D311CC2
MYNTGARVSEAIGLRVGDVIIDGSAVAHLHGKGRKERSVPLWHGPTPPQLATPVGRPGRRPFLVPEPRRRAHGALERYPASRNRGLDSRRASPAAHAPSHIAAHHPPLFTPPDYVG